MRVCLIVLCGIFVTGLSVMAGGFAVQEQSAKGLGMAFSGTATGLGDASSVYFNPAAMSRLGKKTATVAGHMISPQGEFNNNGSIHNPALGSIPVSGGNGGDSGSSAMVPNIYLARGFGESFHVGFGVNAPYGLESKYPDGWVGRYHGLKSDLQVVNLNLAGSYKINDFIAVGAGFSYYEADAELSNAIDFGTIGVSILGPGAGFVPGQNDGSFLVKGDDTTTGFNAGVLITPNDRYSIGIGYRSSIDIKIEGDATFVVPAEFQPIAAQTGLFQNTSGVAEVELPAQLHVGYDRQLNDKWRLAFDYLRYEWSSFDELRIQFDNPRQADAVVDEAWDDTNRFALGFDHVVSDTWGYRFGVAYEETPIPDAEHRTPRIPDNDRTWLSLGFSYQPAHAWTVDFGASYLIMSDGDVNTQGSTGDILKGSYDLSVFITSLQLTWKP
ncbi:MAG: outer membrane protein transport protein [Acidobacteria bacterium]|nr:outer membrane protein transport protein [Acidobacteriota bacterium]